LQLSCEMSRLSDLAAFLVIVRTVFSLKLLWVAADIWGVQKSVLISGLSLALCGAALVGVGEWAAGRLGNAEPEGRSPASLASSDARDLLAPMSPSLPILPESSDHLPANAPDYTFRREIPEVRLQFTVADGQGRAVKDLSSSDVRVFDNQTAVSRFSEFERDDNLPLQIGLLIDTSDSVKRVLPEEKAAALRFLDRVLRPQIDSAFVIAFGGEFRLWQAPTNDRQALADAIAHMQEPGWGTRFYDALYEACDGQLAANTGGKPQRRALVVVSDGDDNQSVRAFRDVVAMALRSEAQIYALTIQPRKTPERSNPVLQRLAEATGGRVYIARGSKDLDVAFSQIEQDLRTQYYVSFPPQKSTPGFHSLRVEVRAPQPLQVHARQGYYALAQ
jgi:Ca-activated chloride channel family protein